MFTPEQVWDVLSDQEAIDIAAQHLGQPQEAAAAVGRAAYERGSLDNITVTFVQFGWNADRAQAVLEERLARQNAENTDDIDMFA